MSFDEIPENTKRSYPCECGGNITKNEDGSWECDLCDWQPPQAREGENYD